MYVGGKLFQNLCIRISESLQYFAIAMYVYTYIEYSAIKEGGITLT